MQRPKVEKKHLILRESSGGPQGCSCQGAGLPRATGKGSLLGCSEATGKGGGPFSFQKDLATLQCWSGGRKELELFDTKGNQCALKFSFLLSLKYAAGAESTLPVLLTLKAEAG